MTIPLGLVLDGCDSYTKIRLNYPAAPTAVTASAGIGTVTLRWDAPLEEDDVTHYSIYSAEAPWSAWTPTLERADADAAVLCCTFTKEDLENDVTYGFVVVAVNENGEGPPSTQVTARPPGWIGTRQVGTDQFDEVQGIAVWEDQIVIAGVTRGGFAPYSPQGFDDLFLKALDRSGDTIWTRQLGTSQQDSIFDLAVDASGNTVAAGAGGAIDLATAGAVLLKYDSTGTKLWNRSITSGGTDIANTVAVDSLGAVYVAGSTSGSLDGANQGGLDAFVAKYSPEGNQQWIRQLGTGDEDVGLGITVDEFGAAYVTGKTKGLLQGTANGSEDLFLAKYSASGVLQWVRQVGDIGTDVGEAVSVDENGHVFVVGRTETALMGNNALGSFDVVLIAFDGAGNVSWSDQIGSDQGDEPYDVGTDSDASVYVVGSTSGDWNGEQARGQYDLFLAKWNPQLELEWVRLLGTTEMDWGTSVVAAERAVYVGGWTHGGIDGNESLGDRDGFLAKYDFDGDLQ